MKNINSVVISGNLTRDCEKSYTNGGACAVKFAVAVNEPKKNGDQWEDYTSYIDVTYWGKAAEAVSQYLHKGQKVCVQGRIRQDRWTDETGTNHYKVGVIADGVELEGGKPSGGNSGNGGGRNRIAPPGAPQDDGGEFSDDCPF